MIDLGANGVYIIPMYVKRWGFALKWWRNSYFLNIVDGTPTAYNKDIIDQETFKLELKLWLYWELILFNVTDIRDSDVILEFLWLKTTEPLIFWA